MSKVMRILLEFGAEYTGSPLYISGNALRHALGVQVNTSVGMFTTESHLFPAQSYQEFFLPRIKKCFLPPYFETWWDKIHQKSAVRCYFLPSYVTFDLIDPPEDIIETIRERDLIQLGGKRNCCFGMVALKDHLEIDLDVLTFPKGASHLTLLSPVLYLPAFAELYDCRYKILKIWNHNRVNPITAIAPGQFFRIKPGTDIAKIAQRGILRKVLLGKFGFGEFIVHNWNAKPEEGQYA